MQIYSNDLLTASGSAVEDGTHHVSWYLDSSHVSEIGIVGEGVGGAVGEGVGAGVGLGVPPPPHPSSDNSVPTKNTPATIGTIGGGWLVKLRGLPYT
mmetsp:Transcript_65851/g.174612  ORF Transcript_65851/g.174612 Transcript_65851/m.174612 type:complete len:97 (-) Transcript_65851:2-292(-)